MERTWTSGGTECTEEAQDGEWLESFLRSRGVSESAIETLFDEQDMRGYALQKGLLTDGKNEDSKMSEADVKCIIEGTEQYMAYKKSEDERQKRAGQRVRVCDEEGHWKYGLIQKVEAEMLMVQEDGCSAVVEWKQWELCNDYTAEAHKLFASLNLNLAANADYDHLNAVWRHPTGATLFVGNVLASRSETILQAH